MRKSYGKDTIEILKSINNLSDENALKLYRRLYGQARRLYKEKDRPFRITRELYYSLIGTNNFNAFRLTEDRFSIDKSWKISDAKILFSSLAPLIEKTKRNGKSPIEELIMDYLEDKISYAQFKDSIEEYKNTVEYKAIQKEIFTITNRKKRRKTKVEDLDISIKARRGKRR